MQVSLSATDSEFLSRAIEISRHALEDEGKTPFGAIIVIDRKIIAEGTSSVVELMDPTAHAEIMALRKAGASLQRHLMPDAVMYASSEPCPMCLVACYWARIPRLLYGASSYDVGAYGFEDLQLYRELTVESDRRTLRVEAVGGALHDQATAVLRAWAGQLPEPVIPKL
ncbi:nucleoside deaminase [Dactylosporangium sp. NPDC050588]|uniref:nucleoside deaminase n=1 Tax=Dactylosporangium sp. NPDC050588 TaxID=3157211 RepID=UPI003407D6D1